MQQYKSDLRLQPPRFQMPRTLQERFTPTEVIHSFCNILFESWIRPNTKEYSYHIISLDNFSRVFHRNWNSLTKFNHPPRRVQTFTLALEKDMFIVLKYSARHRVERFLVLTQTLIKFIAELYKKQTENQDDQNTIKSREGIRMESSLIVRVSRSSLSEQVIHNIETSIENSYSITYGPSLQQLFECYIRPEMENPYMLLGHALTLSAIQDLVTEFQINTARNNLLYSKFVRTTDVEPNSEAESEESEEQMKVQKQVSTLPDSNTPALTPQIQNVERMRSPFEADVPSSIIPEKNLSKWREGYYQESANMGCEDSRLANKEQDHRKHKNNERNEINKKHQNIEQVTKSFQHEIRENPNELIEDIVDMGPLDLCCGLDSRYCRCYRLNGYIPKTLNYELVRVMFSPFRNGSWQVIFAKYSYDSAYDNLYETGNIMRSSEAANNAEQMSLADAVKQYGNEILNNKYMAAIPCKIFRMWQRKKFHVGKNGAKLLVARLGDKNNLSKLGILDTAVVVFKKNEFQNILRQFTTFFACNSGSTGVVLANKSGGKAGCKNDIDMAKVIMEPGSAEFISETEGQTAKFSQPETRTYEVRNSQIKTKSIGLQVELNDIPFSMDCIAEIHRDVNTPVVTSDDIFKHGFETWLEADYLTRATCFQNGRKLETEKYVIHFLKDKSVSILLKECSEEGTIPQKNKTLDGIENLVTDSLEWNIEMIGPGPVPFYFKKLKPAYITTENDFPSTLVAKKKIGNLVNEVNAMIDEHKGKRPIPVLWNTTKTLELSTVRFHKASKQLYLLFERNIHQKYSINTIYLPDSTSSKKIYNTKYGTFDTLQMHVEIQQTSKVITKISDYPKPLLIIISDAFVLNNGLIQQYESLYQLGNQTLENKLRKSDEGINPRILKPLVENRVRNCRPSAIKPPNFYNEKAILLRLNDIADNYVEYANENSKNLTPPVIEQAMMDLCLSSDDEEGRLVINESMDEQNAETVTEHVAIANVTDKSEDDVGLSKRDENSKQEQWKEEISIRPASTLVKTSIPLQKKYALIQEKGREKRRKHDKMFLKSDISRFQPRDLNVNQIKIVHASSAKSKNCNLRRESSTESRKQVIISKKMVPSNAKKATSKSSNLTPTEKRQLSSSGELQERSKTNQISQLSTIYQRTQIIYDDLLTPANDYNHNLEKARTRCQLALSSTKFLQHEQTSSTIHTPCANTSESNTIDPTKEVSQEKENIGVASSTENNCIQAIHNVEGSIPTHTISKCLDNSLGTTESDNRRPLTISNKKHSNKSTIMSANEGNLSDINNTVAKGNADIHIQTSESELTNNPTISGESARDVDQNSVNETALDLSTTLPKENDLQSLTLPQLMLAYPKTLPECQTKSKDSTLILNKNDGKRDIYKRVLKAKMRENLFQQESERKIVQASNTVNTEVDSDVSVDIKVTLSQLNGSTELLTSTPIVRKRKDNVGVASNCIERGFSSNRSNIQTIFNEATVTKKSRKNSEFESSTPKKAAASRIEDKGLNIEGESAHTLMYRSTNIESERNSRRDHNFNNNEKTGSKQTPRLPFDPDQSASSAQVTLRSSSRCPNVPPQSATSNSNQFHPHDSNQPQPIEDQVPFTVFSPHPPFLQSPEPPYMERVDELGNCVSAHPRSSSTYRQPYSTNMHNSSFVPTVPKFFHVRRPAGVMMAPHQQHSQYNHIETAVNNQHIHLPAPHSIPTMNNFLTPFQADSRHLYRSPVIETASPAIRDCNTHWRPYAPSTPAFPIGYNMTQRPIPATSGAVEPPLLQQSSPYFTNQYRMSHSAISERNVLPHSSHIRHPFVSEIVSHSQQMNPIFQPRPINTSTLRCQNIDPNRQIENQVHMNNLNFTQLLQFNCSSHCTRNHFSGF